MRRKGRHLLRKCQGSQDLNIFFDFLSGLPAACDAIGVDNFNQMQPPRLPNEGESAMKKIILTITVIALTLTVASQTKAAPKTGTSNKVSASKVQSVPTTKVTTI